MYVSLYTPPTLFTCCWQYFTIHEIAQSCNAIGLFTMIYDQSLFHLIITTSIKHDQYRLKSQGYKMEKLNSNIIAQMASSLQSTENLGRFAMPHNINNDLRPPPHWYKINKIKILTADVCIVCCCLNVLFYQLNLFNSLIVTDILLNKSRNLHYFVRPTFQTLNNVY